MLSHAPKFAPFETWAACPRCGFRVAYSTLRREKLTGLLLCTAESGGSPGGCWDPWHPSLSFQAKSDRSIEPPPEPRPAPWGLDDVFSAARGMVPAVRTDGSLTRIYATNFSSPGAPGIYATAFSQGHADGPRFVDSPGSQGRQPPSFPPIQSAEFDGVFVPTQSQRVNVPEVTPGQTPDPIAGSAVNVPEDEIRFKI